MSVMTGQLAEFVLARIGDEEARITGISTDILMPRGALPESHFRHQSGDCRAKREIVTLALRLDDADADDGTRAGSRALEGLGEVILKILAAPHQDHPDYRDEWLT